MSAARLRLIVMAIAGALAAAAIASVVAADDEYTIVAHFRNAAGLRENSPVKIDGVSVGKVQRLELAADGRVRATLGIEPGAAPLGRGARANIRTANLFGGKYVDLGVGDAAQPAASGVEIPLRRTGAPVEIDDVLAALDPSTRARLRILIAQSGVALAGRGADFAHLLERLPRSLDRTRTLVEAVAEDNEALGRLLEESDRLTASLAPKRRSLGNLVESAQGAFSTIAGRRRELRMAVERAPGMVAQLRSTLTRIQATARPLGPAAERIRETATPLTELLRELPRFQPAAAPTLATVRRVAPDLTRLARGTTPLVTRLGPTSEKLDRFAASLAPVSDLLDRGIEDSLATIEGWARAIQLRDGPGHVFRGQLVLNEELATTLIDRYVKDPGAPADEARAGGRAVARRGRADRSSEKRSPARSEGRAGRSSSPPVPGLSSSSSELKNLLDLLLK